MGGFFKLDSPFMNFMGKITDFIVLNLIVLISSIPIVTIGASTTAMHYVLLKISRNESNYVFKEFAYAFKKNFKEATILWLIYLVMIVAISLDYWFFFSSQLEFASVLKYLIGGITILILISMIWSFILLSRYENTARQILINSYYVAFSNLGKTLIMGILSILPWILLILIPITVPVILLLGISVSGYLQVHFYEKVFEKLEN